MISILKVLLWQYNKNNKHFVELEKKIQSLNSDNLSIIVDDFENVEHFEVSRLDAQENNPDKLLKFQVYQTDVLIEVWFSQ